MSLDISISSDSSVYAVKSDDESIDAVVLQIQEEDHEQMK